MYRLDNKDTVLKSEHLEQVEFVAWFRRTYPDVKIFAIPNGGFRGKAQAGKLKAEGVSPGVPDLYVPAWRLWVEMKRESGGTLSPAQKEWRDYLQSIGDKWMVAKGFEDAKNKLLTL